MFCNPESQFTAGIVPTLQARKLRFRPYEPGQDGNPGSGSLLYSLLSLKDRNGVMTWAQGPVDRQRNCICLSYVAAGSTAKGLERCNLGLNSI